jgi:hypothetical protein
MSISVDELYDWLDTLDQETEVFIDKDGLSLGNNIDGSYLEVGGESEE